ncbi:uncharacterized protein IWZ02DRAFT_434704 [Phyllosticta citriasiana]|uniref:uncharacterized protein n=1 Tax=Phyllosticta citriasiana TaxID=595635 RepID=UPI0030FD89F8
MQDAYLKISPIPQAGMLLNIKHLTSLLHFFGALSGWILLVHVGGCSWYTPRRVPKVVAHTALNSAGQPSGSSRTSSPTSSCHHNDHNRHYAASAGPSASASLVPGAFDLGDGFAGSFLDFSISDFNATLLDDQLAHNDIDLPATSSVQAPSTQQPSDFGLFDYIHLNPPFAQTPSSSSSGSDLGLGNSAAQAADIAVPNPILSISEFDLSGDRQHQGIQSLGLDPGLSFDDLGVDFGAATAAICTTTGTTAESTPGSSTAALSTAPPPSITTTPTTAPLVSFSPATTTYSYSQQSQESHTPPVAPTTASSSSSSTSAATTTTKQPMSTHKRPRDVSASPPPASLIDKRKRNSIAARKCRQKKLDRIEALEQALAAMTAERDELRVRMARMEGEMEGLKKAREN